MIKVEGVGGVVEYMSNFDGGRGGCDGAVRNNWCSRPRTRKKGELGEQCGRIRGRFGDEVVETSYV